jgi:hypothetical protein
MIALGPPLFGQGVVVHTADDGKLIDQLMVVSATNTSYASFRKVALKFVLEWSTKRKVYRLIVGDHAKTVSNSVHHGQMHGLDYGSTMAFIHRAGLPSGTVARLFGVGQNAILTYRSPSEYREEILVGQSNPLVLTTAHLTFELLHFHLSRGGGGAAYALQVFARSPVVSSGSTIELLRLIRAWSNATIVTVSVKPIAWFADESNYPAMLPFQKDVTAPSKADYERAPALTCGVSAGKVTCSGRAFSP